MTNILRPELLEHIKALAASLQNGEHQASVLERVFSKLAEAAYADGLADGVKLAHKVAAVR